MSGRVVHDAATNAAGSTDGDRLAALRARIAQVGRRRRGARRLSAASRIALAILLAAGALFLADWMFAPGRLARLIMLLVAAAAVARVFWRRVRPGLAARETEAEIALLIEKQHGIDSDLVAALEFANGSMAPGSADLRGAVVDYVAEFGRSWQMPREAIDPKLRRRLGWLALAVATGVAAVAVRPDFAAAFVDRMLLGRAHYPTRTRIESLTVGGTSVDPAPWAAASVACPLGRPIGFEVGIGGTPPRLARIRVASVQTGGTTEIDLVPDTANSPTTYAARLPRLAESVDVQVFAGDAWTEPVRVRAIAPPLVDVALYTTLPAYAGGGVERAAQAARQVTVLEGSRVDLAVRCTNKNLASATLVIDGAEHPLASRTGNGSGDAQERASEWTISGDRSPLARLDRTVTYEIRVVDEDGLGTDTPVVGSIRVKPDAPPRVTAAVQTRLVLPTATPRLAWQVADDHAIARVEIVVEPVSAADDARAPADPGSDPARPRQAGQATIPIALSPNATAWLGKDRLPLEGLAPVKLDGLGLQVGDQVRLIVRAIDYRGDAAGRATESEPVVLEVTDERGILAGLLELDELSLKQLDAIIDRELRVGGTR